MSNTKNKEASVAKLREALNDVLQGENDVDDYELNKWLIARNYDVAKAGVMYRESLAFKKKKHVESLFDTYEIPEVLVKCFPGGLVGFDPTGSPVVVELFGRYDMEGLMKSCRRSDLEKVKLFQCEATVRFWKEQTKRLGRRVDGVTVIFDMEGVGTKFLWKPGLDMYMSLIKILEDNYPEMLKRLCVVNAPSIFPYLWNLVTPLVSVEMKNKIVVLKRDEHKEQLIKFVGKHCLPAYLGGELTDPDGNPRCVTMINQGGTVQEKYYLKVDPSLKTIVVNRRQEFVVFVDILAKNTLLCWEFQSEDHDIGFEVKFLNKIDGEENIIKAYNENNNNNNNNNNAINDITNVKYSTSPSVTMHKNDKCNNKQMDIIDKSANNTNVDNNSNCNDEVIIVAKQRISSNYLIEDGCHLCQLTGKYKITFDNTYSWTKSKTLHYKVWAEPFKAVINQNQSEADENLQKVKSSDMTLEKAVKRFNDVFNTKNIVY